MTPRPARHQATKLPTRILARRPRHLRAIKPTKATQPRLTRAAGPEPRMAGLELPTAWEA